MVKPKMRMAQNPWEIAGNVRKERPIFCSFCIEKII